MRDGLNYIVYVMLFMSEMLKIYQHVFAHNLLNIQRIFNPGKSFEKLRHRAFQPCMLEMLEIDLVHLKAVMLFMSETSEIVLIFNIHRI